ncbi:hypothetical protein ACHAWF_013102 [Thalassiosira exigua]
MSCLFLMAKRRRRGATSSPRRKMKIVDYVASEERKRRLRMICSSWPPTEKVQQKKRRSMVCGTVKRPIGNVVTTKSRVLKRMSKNDSVLHKHVKWLKELQEERRRLEEKKEADHREQIERKRLFMEREAKKRASGKGAQEQQNCAPSAKSTLADQDTDDSTIESSVGSTTTESKREKPAWCQSESEHEASEEMASVNDEINLLNFVNDLDFDQYTQDLELQTLMGQVKARIKRLECENNKDETKLQTCLDSETAARRAEALDNGPVVDFTPLHAENEHATDDSMSIANSVMSETSIRSIHSKKSLAVLVTKARERISEMGPIEEEEEKAVSPPVLSTVTDDNGARMKETRALNKLAFKNRNPAL